MAVYLLHQSQVATLAQESGSGNGKAPQGSGGEGLRARTLALAAPLGMQL